MATEVELAPETRGGPRVSGAGSPKKWWRHPAVLVVGLVIVAGGIPLAMALGVLAQPRWYPVSDYAQLELRVRDITTRHPPLIGLQGRIMGYGQQGSHPGPIVFYSLFPVYKLFGSQPWGLLAGAVALNLTAMGAAIAIAYRRGGRVAALGMAAAIAVLARAYDIDKLVEPWTPYVVLIWWVVFLLAVWSLFCEDLPLLPVAVFAGTFCVQATFSYMGVVFGVGAFAVAVGVVWMVRRRHQLDWRRLARWGIPSALLLVVLWIPPLIEQFRNDPGNLSIIRASFSDPTSKPQGFGWKSLDMWLGHLNIGVLLTHTRRSISVPPTSPIWPGVLLLAVWGAAAVVAWRSRQREPGLWRLHVVVAAALAFGYLSISRVIGMFYDYVVLWAWGTTTLLVVATLWTFLASKGAPGAPLLAKNGLVAGLAAILVVASASFTYDAAFAEMPMAPAARFSQHVSPQIIEALEHEDPDQQERYLFRWDRDSYALDFSAWGLFIEMQREGFDVGLEDKPWVSVPARPIRVRLPQDATAAVTYVLGPEIETWRATPEVTEIAYYEPRSDAEVAEYEKLIGEIKAGLREANLDELVPLVEVQMLVVSADDRTPDALHPKIARTYEIAQPVAVFLGPVDVRPAA